MTHETVTSGRDGLSTMGQASLRALDKLLAERPQKIGHEFSEATRCLTGYRDALITRWRKSGDAADFQLLAQVNAVLSIVIAGHFPLGDVPWGHVEQARGFLAKAVAPAPTA